MYLKNRRLSLGFKLLAAIVAACGITLNTGILKGTFDPGKFLYFTMLSNVFCLIVLLLGAARDVRALRGGQGGAPVAGRIQAPWKRFPESGGSARGPLEQHHSWQGQERRR